MTTRTELGLAQPSSVARVVRGNFTSETWAEWEARGDAIAIDGAVAFVDSIHQAGGHMAFVTNRKNHDADLELLKNRGMWAEGDRLCVKTETSDKATRRATVRDGARRHRELRLGGAAHAGLILGWARHPHPQHGQRPVPLAAHSRPRSARHSRTAGPKVASTSYNRGSQSQPRAKWTVISV